MSVRHACISTALLLLISFFCPLQLLAQATPNPVPLINIPLSPTTAAPGGTGFTLTIHGTGFVSTSTANWNGSPRATTFVSDSELTVAIPSADLANPGTAAITVTNPTPGGGTSNVATFDVTSPVSPLQFATENFSAVQNLAFFAADLNGDGKIDLVGGLSLMALCVSLGVGDGSFQSPVCIPDAPPMTALIAGDFNGDGKLDLAGVNDDGLYIFLGNGDGTFQAPQNFQLAAVDPPQAVTLTSGDFNGDGKLDLVLAGPDAGLTIFLGNGDGTFQPPVHYPISGSDNFSVAVGDFNGDGKLDVISENVLLLGNGDGTFTQQASPVAVDQADQILTADLNGDGKLDLIVLSPRVRGRPVG